MITTLHLAKENFKFSAGHFTIFSASERENLHGHNFTVAVELSCEVLENGMTFDYGLAKRAIEHICRMLNETFLLPENSPHLRLERHDTALTVHFHNEAIPFLLRDVTLLPVRNITVEELSEWFLQQLASGFAADPRHHIHSLAVTVFSGPGQGATARRDL